MIRLQKRLGATYTEASEDELAARIGRAKAALGESVLILGHHYQRDEVIRWTDATGDSLALARHAASHPETRWIVFCGVHFMAESADIITGPGQAVILPDLNAGCSMADMADSGDVELAWNELSAVTDVDTVVPITYVNSTAKVKAFVGAHGGSVCTSTNARAIMTWALDLEAGGDPRRDSSVFFLPDQHLGRNTAFQLGYSASDMAVYDPRLDLGGLAEKQAKEATVLLWKGHCSVHQRFTVEQVEAFRRDHPSGLVIVHPECPHEVVERADATGSTNFIINEVEKAAAGTQIAIGTEIHLVNRIRSAHPDKEVVSLDPLVCPCSTMFRIDPAHLCWVLEGLVDGEVRNRITVDEETAALARVALERMLALS